MPYDKKGWTPDPKPEPKQKKTKQQMWNDMQKKSRQKQIKKHIMIAGADKLFYMSVWDSRPKYCEECNRELNPGKPDDEKYYENIRWMSHHILSKSKFKQFRHTPLNIALLCKSCHAKAESAISYPRMRIFEHLESVKQHLLA